MSTENDIFEAENYAAMEAYNEDLSAQRIEAANKKPSNMQAKQPCPTCLERMKPIWDLQAAAKREVTEQAATVIHQATTEERRRQLTGRSRPVLLQAAEGADPSYPESSYPRKNDYPVDQPNNVTREIKLENEKMRQYLFGYSRNEKGTKLPYEKLLQRTHTVKWTCPNCGNSYDLPSTDQTGPATTAISQQAKQVSEEVSARRRTQLTGTRTPFILQGGKTIQPSDPTNPVIIRRLQLHGRR